MTKWALIRFTLSDDTSVYGTVMFVSRFRVRVMRRLQKYEKTIMSLPGFGLDRNSVTLLRIFRDTNDENVLILGVGNADDNELLSTTLIGAHGRVNRTPTEDLPDA